MSAKQPTVSRTDPDFTRAMDLLCSKGRVQRLLAQAEVDANSGYSALVEKYRPLVASLQAAEQALDMQLELIALQHPEWFTRVKTLKTPSGDIKQTTSTSLEIPNEELTLVLLQRLGDKEVEEDSVRASDCYQSTPTLNKDALGTLSDTALDRLKIKRIIKTNIKSTPAAVEIGKAVADQKPKTATAEKE